MLKDGFKEQTTQTDDLLFEVLKQLLSVLVQVTCDEARESKHKLRPKVQSYVNRPSARTSKEFSLSEKNTLTRWGKKNKNFWTHSPPSLLPMKDAGVIRES